MAADLKLISRDDVLNAADQITKRGIKLNPSTGYDVIIGDHRFPPKEIIRYAYRIATDDEVGVIYGGEQVNSILRKLGFEVEQKPAIWKLGCNWKRGSASFFDIIQANQVVLTVEEFAFKKDDIVLITEGFTVHALGKVLMKPVSVTSRPELGRLLEEKEVPYKDWLLYAEVEWYDLTEAQVFIYQLQPGIRQVRKRDVIEKVLDIWENKDVNLTSINFYIKKYNESPDAKWQYPCLVLIPTSAEDFEYRTCYDLNFYKDESTREGIGEVKILHGDLKITELDSHFTELGVTFCSLGQTLAYYKNLRENFPSEFMAIATALRDCVFVGGIKEEFEQKEGFQKSLLRSSEAQRALFEANDLLQHGMGASIRAFSFAFEYQVHNADIPHHIDFSFNHDADLPNRFFCLIGKNGTGKTQILAQLAKKLSDNNEAGTFTPSRPLFTKVIAVSFSLFDKFELPQKADISYELISAKDGKTLLLEEEVANKLWRAYRAILKSRTRKTIWLNCMRTALEFENLKINVSELETIESKQDFADKLNNLLSSGQKIIFHFITRLIYCMDNNSIIIFDEPETHLHPNIAGKLLKALQYTLDNFNSFCILATHSPVIVQEIPSRFIRIIERKENMPVIRVPEFECFGENLTNINNRIFHVADELELYKLTFDKLVETKSIVEIEEIFNHQLSYNARVYLQTIVKERNG